MRPTAGQTKNHYITLGLTPKATDEEIKRRYLLLAKKYHPDMSPGGDSDRLTEIFKEINEAYSVLSDPMARAAYDMTLGAGPQQSGARINGPGHGPTTAEIVSRYKDLIKEDEEGGSWLSRKLLALPDWVFGPSGGTIIITLVLLIGGCALFLVLELRHFALRLLRLFF